MKKIMKTESDFDQNKIIAVILLLISLIGIQVISAKTAFGEIHQFLEGPYLTRNPVYGYRFRL